MEKTLMLPLSLSWPFIDPVMWKAGSLELWWYGLAFGLAFALGAIVLYAELKRKGGPVSLAEGPALLVLAFVAALVCGRLGYVLVISPAYFLTHPAEIVATWAGGMSFHFALAGLTLTGWIYARWKKISFWALADIAAVAVPPGLMFIKIGNFVNGESYGRLTTVPWGVVFPFAGDASRHPCQIYEAILEGPILFAVLWGLRKRIDRPGELGALFLTGYGLIRFFLEFFREPEPWIGLFFGYFTLGQIFCLPMIVAGIAILVFPRKGDSEKSRGAQSFAESEALGRSG
jgi:phosphatidylglycerol:prolipoprotein diacylglycerol transferase